MKRLLPRSCVASLPGRLILAPVLLAPVLLAPAVLGLACNGQDFQVTGIESRLVVSPSLTDFGTQPVGGFVQAQVALQAAEGEVQVLALEFVGDEDSAFSWTEVAIPTVTEDDAVAVIINFAPTSAGYHWAELHVLTDEGEGGEHVVQLRGTAVLGAVRAWPMVVDFGPVPATDSETTTVTLSNQGELDLVLENVVMSGADDANFAVEGLPLELPASSEHALSLTFHATDEEAASALATLDFGGGAELEPLTLRANDCSTADSVLYDQDGDGVSWCADDCDDHDASAWPGGTEVCDGVDNDCNGTIDDGTSCYDDDGDGYSEDEGDCHDGDADIGVEAEEVMANGIDDDCDGVIDDGAEDHDGDGWADTAGDCDDSDADANPGELEVEDGIDNDCDGDVDEGSASFDDDGDHYSEDDGDCDDSDPLVNPDATETANWLDDDCDGDVDEGTDNADDDGDGFSEVGGDCDDEDASVNPGEVEIEGDGIDNDCDGSRE